MQEVWVVKITFIICAQKGWSIGNFLAAAEAEAAAAYTFFVCFLYLKCLTSESIAMCIECNVCKWKIDCIFAISWQLDTCTSPECSGAFSLWALQS